MNEKITLDVKDIMKLTGIGRDSAYDLMKSGEFAVKTIGKKYLVHKEVFEIWLKGEKGKKRW
ncbi:helix-turn-helix domain-containing protein [Neobacillus sp. PS3-40]|uniref:helix-turn-helix domain-containing protein n=1 Tax=Neobacillus sp. PS3-40 TaxID=3070679 RepID=UPI0027E08A8D|nr:helix-turn-helix domain-containing protein [Neobacillus sp. PS3-40]WML44103.1 helix-turn-helix domain-containing protein [Neobacillus sp. PS3-40]